MSQHSLSIKQLFYGQRKTVIARPDPIILCIIKTLKITQPPILLKNIITHLKKDHDLSVYSWDFGDNIDGIQTTEGNTTTIAYNKTKHPHRQRFTVAHEIGHLLLGHTKDDIPIDFDSSDPEEIEANKFAAELLMPLAMLKQDITAGHKKPQLLASRYCVCEESMWWRVLDCQLINKL